MYDIKETFRAKSVPDALELLRTHPGAIPVCGGTDVMIHLKERKLRQAAGRRGIHRADPRVKGVGPQLVAEHSRQLVGAGVEC